MPAPNADDPLRTTDHVPPVEPEAPPEVPTTDDPPAPESREALSSPAAMTTVTYHPKRAAASRDGSAIAPPEAPPSIPGYEIEGLLGKGGMGVVYKARQLALKRLVALKVIRDSSGSDSVRARFRLEAEAAARLQHPNVVQVFEVGECEGELYCVQEYVPGGSLHRKLAGNPLLPAVAARLVESLAGAMFQAHQMQLIHRDLKPANILLRPRIDREGDGGENQPPATIADCDAKVADFGLAKFLDPDAPGMTQNNAVIGTPSYMAPEQALGQNDIGPAADIYALGAILYECLTGRPPFKTASVWETLDLVRTAEPVPPRQLQPGVPRDLETICLQCLRKDPKRRYGSARDLAEDLARFSRGEPVRARAISHVERTVRWVKRRPVVAGLLALLILTVTGFSAVLLERNNRLSNTNAELTNKATELTSANTALEDSEEKIKKKNEKLVKETARAQTEETKALNAQAKALEAAEEAKRQRDEAQRGTFAATLANVVLLADSDPLEGLSLLEDRKRCPPHLRDFTWQLLRGACQRKRFNIRLGGSSFGGIGEVAFPAPEMLVGLLREETGIRVRRFQSGDGLMLGEQLLPVHSAFDSERRTAAVLTVDGTLKRFDLTTGEERDAWRLAELRLPRAEQQSGEQNSMRHVVHSFSADLQRLAVVDAERMVLVYDARSGKLLHRLPIPAEPALPDGPAVAPVPLRLRFTPNRERLVCVVRTRQWSPAGSGKPFTPALGAIHVWDAGEGRHLHRLFKSGQIAEQEEFSPDGRWLVRWVPGGVGKPSDLELFNLTTGRVIEVVRSAGGMQRYLRFAPSTGDTRQLIFVARTSTGMLDSDAMEKNTLSIWDLAGDAPRLVASADEFDIRPILSPDGKTLAVGTNDGLRVFDVATGNRVIGPGKQDADPEDIHHRSQLEMLKPVAFSPDSKRLVTTGLKIWDLASRRELLNLPGAGSMGQIRVKEESGGAPGRLHGSIFFSRDGRTLVVATSINGFTVYQADTELLLGRPLPWNEPVHAVSATPDGRTVAMLGGELRGLNFDVVPRLLLFDVNTARQRAALQVSGKAITKSTATFLADGSALSVDMDGELKLYDQTGRITKSMRLAESTPTGPFASINMLFRDSGSRFPFVLTRDGRQLLQASSATKLEFRDLETNKTAETLEAPGPLAGRPVLTPDNNFVAAGLTDGRVIVWDRAAKSHRLSPGWHNDPVSALAIDARCEHAASLDRKGNLVLWDLKNGMRKPVRVVGDVKALALSPDGRTLVTGSSDGSVRFWDPVTGESRGTFRRHIHPITCLAFSANGKALVTASAGVSRGGELLTWHVNEEAVHYRASLDDAEAIHREAAPNRNMSLSSGHVAGRLALSADGTRLLASMGTERPRLWDLSNQVQVEQAEPQAPLKTIPVRPSLPVLDLEPIRRLLQGLPVEPPSDKQPAPLPPVAVPREPVYQVRREVLDLGFTEDGRTWETMRESTTDRRKLPRLVTLHPDGERDEVLLPRLATLFTRAPGRSVALAAINPELSNSKQVPFVSAFDLVSGKLTTLFEGEERVSLEVSPTGRYIVARDQSKPDQSILSAHTGGVLWKSPGAPLNFQFSPGDQFALVGRNGQVRLLDPATGKTLLEVTEAMIPPTLPGVPIFSPGGRWFVLLATGQKASCRIFETATRTEKPPLPKSFNVHRMAFTPDEKTLLVLLSAPRMVMVVWDVEAGKEVRRFGLNLQSVAEPIPVPETTTVLMLPFNNSPGELFDWQTGKAIREVDLTVAGEPPGAFPNNRFTPDGKTLLRLGQNRYQVWDAATWKPRPAQVTKEIFSPSLSEDLSTVVLVQERTLHVFDAATGKERSVHDIPLPLPGLFRNLSRNLSADGKTIFLLDKRRIDVQAEVQVRAGTAAEPRASFRQYTGKVLALALNRDATRAFSAGEDRLVHVWDPATGKEQTTLAGHLEPVQSLALSPDETHLVSAGKDGLRLWDLHTMKELAVLTGHFDAIATLAFSPDGKLLAAAGEDMVVRLWEVPAGKLRATLLGHRGTIRHAVFDRTGSTLFTCADDRSIKIWDVPPPATPAALEPKIAGTSSIVGTPDGKFVLRGLSSGRLERVDQKGERQLLEGLHSRPALAVALSPDGKVVASGDASGTVLLHEVETGRKKAEWTDHPLPVRALAFSPDGVLLASGEAEEPNLFAPFRPGRILVREASTGKSRHTLWLQNGGIHTLCFTNGGELASGSDDGSVCLWDLSEDKVRLRIPHGGVVRALISGPSGSLFSITGGSDFTEARGLGAVRQWDLETGKEIKGPRLPMARGLVVAAEGKLLLLEQGNKSIGVWDLEQHGFRLFLGTRSTPQNLALTADGKTLIAATAGGGIDTWDLPTQLSRRLTEKPVAGEVLAAVPVEAGKALVGLTLNQGVATLRVWETETLRERRAVPIGQLANPNATGIQPLFAVTEDARLAGLSWPGQGAIQVWDLEKGKLLHRVGDPKTPLHALAFSPDGRWLASAGGDGVVRLWESAAGGLHSELPGHSQGLLSLAFSPDGMFLATADTTSRVRFWDVATGRSAHADGLSLGQKGEIGAVHLAFSPIREPAYVLATSRTGKTDNTSLWPVSRDKEPGAVAIGQPRALPGVNAGKLTFLDQGRSLRVEQGTNWLHDVESGRMLVSFPGAGGPNSPRYFPGRFVLAPESRRVGESWLPQLETWPVGGKQPSEVRVGSALRGNPNGLLLRDGEALVAEGSDPEDPKPAQLLRVPAGASEVKPGMAAPVRPPLAPLNTEADFAVTRVATRPDGACAIVAKGGRVRVVGPDGKPAFTNEPGPAVTAMAFGPDGKLLLLADALNRVRILSAVDGKVQKEWKIESAPTVLALSSNGATLATGHAGGEVVLWKRTDGTVVRRWAAHQGEVGLLVFGPKDEVVASVQAGNTKAFIWATDTGKQLAWYNVATRILRLAYSPDGRQIAILSQRNLHVWDRTTLKQEFELTIPWSLDMAWGREGKTVIVALALRTKVLRTPFSIVDLAVVGRSRMLVAPVERNGQGE
jgi:WD40 repeat protein/serine/threonine protein kinase